MKLQQHTERSICTKNSKMNRFSWGKTNTFTEIANNNTDPTTKGAVQSINDCFK